MTEFRLHASGLVVKRILLFIQHLLIVTAQREDVDLTGLDIAETRRLRLSIWIKVVRFV